MVLALPTITLDRRVCVSKGRYSTEFRASVLFGGPGAETGCGGVLTCQDRSKLFMRARYFRAADGVAGGYI